MKFILFIIDGAADAPVASLQNRTPLEAAEPAAINAYCRRGILARTNTTPAGCQPGTETAMAEIFGANPCRVGRAYVEAAGMGIHIHDDEQALRCNLISVNGYEIASHCGGGVSYEEGKALINAIQNDSGLQAGMEKLGMRLIHGSGFRHILVVNGPVDPTVAPHEILGKPYYLHMSGKWAPVLMRMAQQLEEHPVNELRRDNGRLGANMLWPWGEGERVQPIHFTRKYGLTGACVAGSPIIKGFARLAGLITPDVPGATGEPDTDWRQKVRMSEKLLRDHSFLLLHLEAPDECAHSRDAAGKVESIRMADAMLSNLCGGLERSHTPFRLMVLSDHYTLCETGRHDARPAPFFLYDSRDSRVRGHEFTEADSEFFEVVRGSGLLDRLCRTEPSAL